MIFAAFTNNYKKILPLAPILVVALTLRLYKLNLAFPFDFDQEIPAQAAYDFFTNHKISLVGQELSFQGFFLGPLHNWIQFIPYGICRLMPDCVPYFYILGGLVTILCLYLVLKWIFNPKIALIASFIYSVSFAAISSERGVSSNYFLFLISIALLFCLGQYFAKKDYFLIIGAFLAGIATVNFNPVFIFSSFAFFLTALLRERKKLQTFTISLFAFVINYLPLFIFNFRHNNLLTDSLKSFAATNTGSVPGFDKLLFLTKGILLPFYTNYLFQSTFPLLSVLSIELFTIGYFRLLKFDNKFLYFLPLTIVTSLFGFFFYNGHIPDYYFQQTLLPFIIFISLAIKQKIPLLFFVIVFLVLNLSAAANYQTKNNYQIKKQVVNYVLSDSQNESFNIYYQMPRGFNTGYSYLFKAKNRIPQDGAKNLYILEITDQNFDIGKYRGVFTDKKVSSELIGFVHIVSVK